MTKPLSRTALRRLVVARAYGCCEYCLSQMRYSSHSFAVEHITPRKRGGKTVASNLALACQGCNEHKQAKVKAHDPLTRQSHRAPLAERWRADAPARVVRFNAHNG